MTNPDLHAKRALFSFDHAPVGIVWHDADGKIIHVNHYASLKLEYPTEELVGNYLYKFVVLDTRLEQGSYYDGNPGEGSRHNLFTKQGKVIPVQVVVHGATDDEGGFGCAFFTDITEQIRLSELARHFEKAAGKHPRNPLVSGEEKLTDEVFRDFIGTSRATGELFKMICRVAPTPTTVLIAGETGTGKELVARKIHELSDRKKSRLVKINCATLPAHLVEGELFGFERGAFTGAHARKLGRFELADGGTLFLDEIGEMPLEIQAKLLRVLQEEEFERLGGTATIKVDVRIIAATNRNLLELVQQGLFRSDLYFRLNIFPIHIPALRERREDIPLLADFFARNICQVLNRNTKSVPDSFNKKLGDHDWPGNVRELQNVIERACILSTTDSLDDACLAFASFPRPQESPSQNSFEENERRYICSVLEQTQGKIFGSNGAAARMQLNPRTLASKIKKLGIK